MLRASCDRQVATSQRESCTLSISVSVALPWQIDNERAEDQFLDLSPVFMSHLGRRLPCLVSDGLLDALAADAFPLRDLPHLDRSTSKEVVTASNIR